MKLWLQVATAREVFVFHVKNFATGVQVGAHPSIIEKALQPLMPLFTSEILFKVGVGVDGDVSLLTKFAQNLTCRCEHVLRLYPTGFQVLDFLLKLLCPLGMFSGQHTTCAPTTVVPALEAVCSAPGFYHFAAVVGVLASIMSAPQCRTYTVHEFIARHQLSRERRYVWFCQILQLKHRDSTIDQIPVCSGDSMT